MRDIDPEAIHTAVEPESEYTIEEAPDFRVLPVEVGLALIKDMEIPLAGGSIRVRDPRPCGAAEDRLPVVGRKLAVLAQAIAEHIARSLGRARSRGQGRLEPLVLLGGVVGNQVNNDAQAQVVSSGNQCLSLSKRAEHGVNVAVIRHIVTGILLRGAIERRQPNCVNAQIGNGGKPADNACQVAHSITISIGKRSWINLVNDRVTPPVGGGIGQCFRRKHAYNPNE